MSQLLKGEELMKILQTYHCQDKIVQVLTQISLRLRIESGQLRELLEIADNRDRRILGRFPTKYFDAAFDVRWIRTTKVFKLGEQPGQDRLAIGILAAEELSREEFTQRLDNRASENLLNEANKLINPGKN